MDSLRPSPVMGDGNSLPGSGVPDPRQTGTTSFSSFPDVIVNISTEGIPSALQDVSIHSLRLLDNCSIISSGHQVWKDYFVNMTYVYDDAQNTPGLYWRYWGGSPGPLLGFWRDALSTILPDSYMNFTDSQIFAWTNSTQFYGFFANDTWGEDESAFAVSFEGASNSTWLTEFLYLGTDDKGCSANQTFSGGLDTFADYQRGAYACGGPLERRATND